MSSRDAMQWLQLAGIMLVALIVSTDPVVQGGVTAVGLVAVAASLYYNSSVPFGETRQVEQPA